MNTATVMLIAAAIVRGRGRVAARIRHRIDRATKRGWSERRHIAARRAIEEQRVANTADWIRSELSAMAGGSTHGADSVARCAAGIAEAHGAIEAAVRVAAVECAACGEPTAPAEMQERERAGGPVCGSCRLDIDEADALRAYPGHAAVGGAR